MQNRNSEELFALVKGMSRQEKKSFHLYAKRNVGDGQMKVLAVYYAINTLETYDEKKLLKKLRGIGSAQLPNLKVHLYGLLLDSLRLKTGENIHLQLHQLLDHAQILYNRGFYLPALKTLQRVKALALSYQQISFAFQSVVMEKKIDLVDAGGEHEKINALNTDMQYYAEQLSIIGQLSNQSMLLYAWHKKYGTVRSEEDQNYLHEIFKGCAKFNEHPLSFYPRLYLLQAASYYYLATKNAELFFRAAGDWVALFNAHPKMKTAEPLQYHRGLIYLTEAAMQLNDSKTVSACVELLKETKDEFYKLLAQLNLCLAQNNFDEALLNSVEAFLSSKKNPERTLVLCCKAAMLCLGAKAYSRLADFTHYGIHLKTAYRLDLQYRLKHLHAVAHRQLDNMEIVEYLQLSAKRFAKLHGLIL